METHGWNRESGIPKVGGFSSEKTKLEELGELLEFPRLVATAVLKEAMEGTEEMDWVDPVCVLEGSEFYEVRKKTVILLSRKRKIVERATKLGFLSVTNNTNETPPRLHPRGNETILAVTRRTARTAGTCSIPGTRPLPGRRSVTPSPRG